MGKPEERNSREPSHVDGVQSKGAQVTSRSEPETERLWTMAAAIEAAVVKAQLLA